MGYHTFSYLRMRHRIRRPDSGVRQVEPGICEIDGGHLSFVMGLIHPVIYLSSGWIRRAESRVVPRESASAAQGLPFQTGSAADLLCALV